MQYTIRNIPEEVDRAAREQAEREGRSLNDVLLGALRVGIGIQLSGEKRRDLSAVFGKKLMDDETLAALEEQRKVDPDAWR